MDTKKVKTQTRKGYEKQVGLADPMRKVMLVVLESQETKPRSQGEIPAERTEEIPVQMTEDKLPRTVENTPAQ